jgi:hypothetical protein
LILAAEVCGIAWEIRGDLDELGYWLVAGGGVFAFGDAKAVLVGPGRRQEQWCRWTPVGLREGELPEADAVEM